MKEAKTLWNERMTSYWQEALRYIRLILNSGFLFTIYVLIIIGSYYYSVFLRALPEDFPALVVFIAVFGHLLTRGNVRTFLQRADIVFLLPYEAKLDRYFSRSLLYSFLWQSAIIVVVMIVLTPLYNEFFSGRALPVLVFFLLVSKWWNLVATWEEQRLPYKKDRVLHFLYRAILNLVYVFFLFSEASVGYLFVFILIKCVLYYFYYRKWSHSHSLKWEYLIGQEEKRLLSFYKIANQFTDVPALQHRIHKRRYMNKLLPLLANEKRSVYHYLFPRAFVRANDYAGIYVRLTLVSAIVLALLPSGWIELVVAILFMHLVVHQLKSLFFHYDDKQMLDVYPVNEAMKKEALTELSFRLLIIMTIVDVVVLHLTSSLIVTATALLFGLAYSYFGSRTIIHRHKKQSYV